MSRVVAILIGTVVAFFGPVPGEFVHVLGGSGEVLASSPADLSYFALGIQSGERAVLSKAGVAPPSPNGADEFLANYGLPVTRFPLDDIARTSAATAAGGTPPAAPLTHPPDLHVTFTGDRPDTGFCDIVVYPEGKSSDPYPLHRQLAPSGCNDTTSGVRVPFGLGARYCIDDGHGGNGNGGWGDCEEFGPGDQQAVKHNDAASSFWAWDDQMNFYLTTASDEASSKVYSVSYSSDLGASPSVDNFSIEMSNNSSGLSKTYHFSLPPWCAHPDVWEATKNGNSSWAYSVKGDILTIGMHVGPRASTDPLGVTKGPNNWVGIGVRCKP